MKYEKIMRKKVWNLETPERLPWPIGEYARFWSHFCLQ